MRPSKETFRIAKEAALAKGWERVVYSGSTEDCVVYHLPYDCPPGAIVGIPNYVIVHKDLSVSFANIYELHMHL